MKGARMKKKSIKTFILTDCISFTLVVLILSAIGLIQDVMMDIDNLVLIQLFICTTLIAILMYFTENIPVESQITASFIQFADTALVILGVGGGLFKWFPWKPTVVGEVLVILTVVFIITTMIITWQNHQLAHTINEKIKERHHA
jgi:phage shock protein PspC (stress-responsive transcriptional regulator)